MDRDDWSTGCPGGGDNRPPSHLGGSGLQHVSGGVAHLKQTAETHSQPAVWEQRQHLKVGWCTTVTGDAALPVRLLDPGLTATVFTSVAPAGTLSTAAVDGGIF